MPEVQLDITDARMLEVIEILKEKGAIRFRQEFCNAIGIMKQNVYNIQSGRQHFTAAQIAAACLEYNINANFIVGTSLEPFAKQGKIRQLPAKDDVNSKVNKPAKSRVKT